MEDDCDPCELFLPSEPDQLDSHKDHVLHFEIKQHYTLQSIKDILYSQNKSEFYNNALKFAVVRNPWERIASDAMHLKRHPEDFLKDCDTINEGIKKLCKVQHVINHRFDLNQLDFLKVDGEIAADHIIRFEDLDRGFKEVLEKLKLPTDGKLSHAKKSRYGSYNYVEYYTEETIELVRQRYKRDIEYFGYEFGEK